MDLEPLVKTTSVSDCIVLGGSIVLIFIVSCFAIRSDRALANHLAGALDRIKATEDRLKDMERRCKKTNTSSST